MRRAKIVATLGPATSSYENLRAIIDAGVNVARMNLSHGTYAVHEDVYANIRRAAADAELPIAVLVVPLLDMGLAGVRPCYTAGTTALDDAALDATAVHTTALLVAHAARERTESRGAHRRADHPQASPVWEAHLSLRAGPGGLRVSREPLGGFSAAAVSAV